MPQRGALGVNGIRSARGGESANSTAMRSTSSRENANAIGPALATKTAGGYAPSSAAAARRRGSFGVDLTNTTGITSSAAQDVWLNSVVVKNNLKTQQPQSNKRVTVVPEPIPPKTSALLPAVSSVAWPAVSAALWPAASADAQAGEPPAVSLVVPPVEAMLRSAEEERRFDPMLDGNKVTYAQMCKGLFGQGLNGLQLQEHWANLKFADKVIVTSEQKGNASARDVDVQEVKEYAQDIKDRLFREELVYLPRADYMDTQADLTPKMRMILMDWLIEVHMKYRLRCETLHLTVNLIDRHLTRSPVARKRLQLVGVCAMFIAAKFEEITPPELHDWVYITDRAYTKDEVLGMEVSMLSTLSFQIVVPTAAHFFHIFQKANGCNDMHRCLAQYILELGILDIRMLEHAPSNVVAAALLLSNQILGRPDPWSPVMAETSRHPASCLLGCVELLRQLFDADRLGAGGQLQAVHKKFSMKDRHSVATMMF